MSKSKKIEVVVVSYEDYVNPDFEFPSKYAIRHWSGDFHFYKTSKRVLAQSQVDAEYGSGMFNVREV